ncbi:MAG: MATE family efflux transporter [Deltaproteobacteria bacterium]|nr:MATE family efflux transporter [Deltaproteobacteria bacterium]
MTNPNPTPSRAITRELFDLALPVAGLNFLSVLALAIDTAMCSRLPEAATALTALGFAAQLVFLLTVFMMGLSVGTIALVARARGANDELRARSLLAQSSTATVILALFVTALAFLSAPAMLRALGAEPMPTQVALEFLHPLLAATVVNYLNLLYTSILRASGNTKLPFRVALVATVINVIVNYALINGRLGAPSLGVRGAALGTVTAQIFSLIVTFSILRAGTVPSVRPAFALKLDLSVVSQILRVGTPAALDMILLNLGFLALIGMLGRIDATAVAAHGIGLRIQALAFVPGLGVSQASGALIGQALGARDAFRARAVVRSAILMCTTLMASLGLAIVASSDFIVSAFEITVGTELHTLTVLWLKVLGYSMPIFGLHIALVGLLQGSGATWTSLGINLTTTIGIQIPLALFLGFSLSLGPLGIWMSFPLSFLAKAVLELVAYRRGGWAKLGTTIGKR